MKTIVEILLDIFIFPFIVLGGIIAVIRAFIILTFGFAWKIGNKLSDTFIYKIEKYLQ